jgi:hypothetical protein
MTDFAGVRQASQNLTLKALLTSPVTVLEGVSAAAADALDELGIKTVFDLGGSRHFNDARELVAAANPGGLASRFGSVPADWLDATAGAADAIGELQVSAIPGIAASVADALAQACGIATIADLAHWPPFAAARDLISVELGAGARDPLAEDPAADALRPRLGEFPVERVYYDTLVLIDVRKEPQAALKPLDEALPLGLDATLDQAGFRQIGIGARASLCQSWRATGVTLGNLLHSLALAPGEATRMAVLDWSRQTRASTAETIEEQEQLASVLDRARSTKEVQNATAADTQSGFSQSSASASAESGSVAASVETGLIPSLWASGGVSGGYQSSSSQSQAASLSFTQGTRDLWASMEQKVNDRTEQHASSARSRRASVVREVSETEHASASTRIVANYNHMHALTVQYWEVVQIYDIHTALQDVERVLFLPIKLPDVTSEKVLDRFRGALTAAALTPRIRDLLVNVVASVGIRGIAAPLGPGWKPASVIHPELVGLAALEGSNAASAAAGSGALGGVSATLSTAAIKSQNTASAIHRAVVSEAGAIAKVLGSPVLRAGTRDSFYPDDSVVTGVRVVGPPLRLVRFEREGASAAISLSLAADQNAADLDDPLPLSSVRSLDVAKSIDAAAQGQLYLRLERAGRVVETLPISFDLPQGTQPARIASFHTDEAERHNELVEHLKLNAVHYGQAAVRSLDPASVVMLLGGYELDGVPVASLVDPTPLGMAGNWLVLRAPVDKESPSGLRRSDLGTGAADEKVSWGELLERQAVSLGGQGNSRQVPMPTGGIFAEAVLGRSNSAEKLDITRFWNWQDSPIPLAPTDIVPPDLGTRARDEAVMPSQLGAPVLNVMQPPAAPEPAGLSAVLNAVANGAMFRDMSGLAGTQQLTQSVQQGAVDSTTAAGQIVSNNMRTQAQKAVAMAQVAADIIKSIYGKGGGGGGGMGGGNVSQIGAHVAQGQSLDKRGAPLPGSGGAAMAAPVPAPAGPQSPRSSPLAGQPGVVASGQNPFANEQLASALYRPGGNEELVRAVPSIADGLMRAGDGALPLQNVSAGSAPFTDAGQINDPALLTGTASFDSVTIPAGERICFPVSAFNNSNFAAGFGLLAERYIQNDYIETMGNPPGAVYFDNNNPAAYLNFLKTHNPGLTDSMIAEAMTSAVRPDIARDDGATKEYYEIKPFSPAGVGAGMGKLVTIMAYMSALGLPYAPGVAYSPSKDIPVLSGVLMGCKLGVTLNVQRPLPGTLLYSLCLQGELKELLAKVGMAALSAWIVAQILARAPLLVLV